MAAIPQQLTLPAQMVLPLSLPPPQQPYVDTAALGAARVTGITQWKSASDEMISTTLARIGEITKVDAFLIKGWWEAIYGAAEKTIKDETDQEQYISKALEDVRKSVSATIQDPMVQMQVMYEFVQCEMMLLISMNKSRREWLSRKHTQASAIGNAAHTRNPQQTDHHADRDDTSSDGSAGDYDYSVRTSQQESHRDDRGSNRGRGGSNHGERGGARGGRDHRERTNGRGGHNARGGSQDRRGGHAPNLDAIFGPPSH